MANQVPLTRQALEKAVREYKREKASYFQLPSNLKPKQIPNAIARFAPTVAAEDVVALMDTTLMNSGKDGYLITQTHMYGKSFAGKTIDLNRVCKASYSDGYLTVTYPDGAEDKLYCIIFEKDLFEFLKLVMQESDALNRQAEEKAVQVLSQKLDDLKNAVHEPRITSDVEIVPTPVVYETMEESADAGAEPKSAGSEDPEELFRQGTAAFMAKNYAAAREAFRKAADLGHPKAAKFLAQLNSLAGE